MACVATDLGINLVEYMLAYHPVSLLAGLMSLHVGLVSNLTLWSFRVIKCSFAAKTFMRSASSSLLAMSEELISFTSFMRSFWKEATLFLNFMMDIKLYMAFSTEVRESFGSGNLAVLNPYLSFSLLGAFLLSWCIAVHLSRLATFSHCYIHTYIYICIYWYRRG